MIDCGEGAQLSFMRKGLKFNRLNDIFLTHLHGDHVLGLPGLISTMGLMQRTHPLTIHTFEEGAEMIRTLIDFFYHELPYELKFNIIKAERHLIYEDDLLEIRTVPLSHRVKCVGYIFRQKPKKPHLNIRMAQFHGLPRYMYNKVKDGEPFIKPDGTIIPAEKLTLPAAPAYSYAHLGDTAYIPQLAKEIGPVSLLYHESTYLSAHEQLARERGHSTAGQAAMFARDAGAARLLLGHYSSRIKDDKLPEEEARAIFPDSIAGYEGLTIDIE